MTQSRLCQMAISAAARIDKLAKKYTGTDNYNRRHAEQRVMVPIKPHHVPEAST